MQFVSGQLPQCMRMRVFVGLVLIMCGLAVIVTADASASSSQLQTSTTQQRTGVSVQMDFLWAGYHAPFFYALEKGYWKRRGLDVTIRQGNGSANGIKTILGGLNNFGLFDRPTMAVAMQQERDLIAVMGLDNRGGWCVTTLASENILTPRDLIGKQIATQLGGADGTLLPAFLKTNGVDPGQVKIQSVDPAAKTTLFLANRVDGATYINYAQVPIVRNAGLEIKNMLWSNFRFPVIGAGLVVSRSWAEKHPGATRAFIAGFIEGLRAAKANPGAAINAMMKTVPSLNYNVAVQQLKLFLAAAWTKDMNPKKLQWGTQTPQSWNSTIDIMRSVDLLHTTLPVSQYFTNAYLPKLAKVQR